MQIKTKPVSRALCFVSFLLYPALADAQSGGAAPEGQPREESTLGAGPTSSASPAPAPAPAPMPAPVLMAGKPSPGGASQPALGHREIQRDPLRIRRIRLHSRLHPELQRSGRKRHHCAWRFLRREPRPHDLWRTQLPPGLQVEGPRKRDRSSPRASPRWTFSATNRKARPARPGSPAVSESAYFASPTFRIRHMALKLETPYRGRPGRSILAALRMAVQLPSQQRRDPGIARAGLLARPPIAADPHVQDRYRERGSRGRGRRPPQRDSGLPDGQAGLRLILNDWKGMRTAGGTGTSVDPLSVGVSGVARRFRLPIFAAAMPPDPDPDHQRLRSFRRRLSFRWFPPPPRTGTMPSP